MSFKNWCFTAYDDVTFDEELVKYIVYQDEICPKTKKLHHQGYVELHNKMRITGVKKRVFKSKTIHLECRKGTQDEAINYCKKLESAVKNSLYEWGTKSRQGDRTDLESLCDYIKDGHTVKETIYKFGGQALRYINHVEKTTMAVWDQCPIDKYIMSMRREQKLLFARNNVDINEDNIIKPYNPNV